MHAALLAELYLPEICDRSNPRLITCRPEVKGSEDRLYEIAIVSVHLPV